MKKFYYFAVIIAVLFIVSGCPSMPTTEVRTSDDSPMLAFIGVSTGSVLFVDGLKIGDPSLYDGVTQVLRVESGTHLIEIQDRKGKTIFRSKIFIVDELKTISVQ